MSFHSSLIADAVWPADIRTALSLSDAASVYAGVTPRGVRQDVEVWIERLESVQIGQGGGDQTKEHRYALHVRSAIANRGPDKTAKARQDVVEAHQQTLVDRYDGVAANQFIGDLTDCFASSAEEGAVDDDDRVLDAQVLVSLFERV